MGITPLYEPEIISDTSFRTSINVIVGHDGSRTVAENDLHDNSEDLGGIKLGEQIKW